MKSAAPAAKSWSGNDTNVEASTYVSRPAYPNKSPQKAQVFEMNPGGFPHECPAGKTARINLDELEKLSEWHVSEAEIAAYFRVPEDEVRQRMLEDPALSEAIERGRIMGNILIRRMQFDLAMKGNVQMLIWLGKNRLGQSDSRGKGDSS